MSRHDATTETLASQLAKLIKLLEQDIREGYKEDCKPMVDDLILLLRTFVGPQSKASASSGKSSFSNCQTFGSEDLQLRLEQIYNDLQSNLIAVRQAVAMSIATEKQLEQQLQKNRDQTETWHNRAAMAEQQGNPELRDQALQRKAQYAAAAKELADQLAQHKESTNSLRQKLTDLEACVQRAYTQKQILIARDKAANAIIKANKIMAAFNTEEALSALKKFEQQVIDKEAEAAKGLSDIVEDPFEYSKSLKEAITNLQQTNEAFVKLDKMISEPESE